MLISHKHKFIFFHVAKVAGLSIRKALDEYGEEPQHFKIRRPAKTINNKANPLYDMWQSFIIHAKAKDAKKVLPDAFSKFYKFAFVRNPWDWQVSMYKFILREPAHISYQKVKSMNNFGEYLDWVISEKKPYAKGACKFQKDVITDKSGKILVDFVGKYENLQKDFLFVCKTVGIEAILPHLNESRRDNYRNYYNQKNKQKVAKYFKEDIELFDYSY